MKLQKFYAIDECTNEELLAEKLEDLKHDGKINFEIIDSLVLKIEDVDLSVSEEKKLIDLFEDLELYDTIYEEEEDDTVYLDNFEEDSEEDYKPRKSRNSSYDDDYDSY